MNKKPPKTSKPPARTGTLDCILALKALSDPRRVEILNVLLTNTLTAGQIAESCALTTYTASRQLSALKRAGLLTCRKDGQHRVYGIAPACEVLIKRTDRTLDLKCCQFRLDTIVKDSNSRRTRA